MKYLPLLLITIFLFSCGGKKTSEKGSWTSDDMNQCITDSKLGLASEPESLQMFEMLGEDMDDVITCFCKDFENTHASYAVAEIAADMMSEEEAGLILVGCMSESTQKMMRLGLEMEGGDW
tara:strand:- start:88 stop:450 length:363 start_codon:yes stop_codon:yes gene_type:complete